MPSETRLEILVLAPYPPYPARSGGASRTLHLARALARRHRVSLLCFGSADERAGLEPLREWCDEVHTVDYPAAARRRRRLYQLRSLVGRRSFSHHAYFSRAMAGALAGLLSRRRFDVVQADASEMGYYWPLPGGVLQVLNTQNVEHLILERTWRGETSRLRRLFARLEARKLRRGELAVCRASDAVLAVSEVDADALRPHVGPVTVRVVPNGVDTDFFTPGAAPEHPGRLLFTGAMGYRPNTDAACHFAERILPIVRAAAPEATFAIVGKDPPEAVRRLAGDGVEVTGTVPDVRPWMRSAEVFVVPLRVGGGTRLKILEAMASGRAVVSTSVGCEGLDVTPEEDILVGDTPEAFAAQVLRCLRDPDLRARLGARGRALVERRYRWDAIGDRLAAFYEELRQAHSVGPGGRRARPVLA
jgi:sugar transferase (PEP-CTERM/EpsH1 system associated)